MGRIVAKQCAGNAEVDGVSVRVSWDWRRRLKGRVSDSVFAGVSASEATARDRCRLVCSSSLPSAFRPLWSSSGRQSGDLRLWVGSEEGHHIGIEAEKVE